MKGKQNPKDKLISPKSQSNAEEVSAKHIKLHTLKTMGDNRKLSNIDNLLRPIEAEDAISNNSMNFKFLTKGIEQNFSHSNLSNDHNPANENSFSDNGGHMALGLALFD